MDDPDSSVNSSEYSYYSYDENHEDYDNSEEN